jgi:magnesium transporter
VSCDVPGDCSASVDSGPEFNDELFLGATRRLNRRHPGARPLVGGRMVVMSCPVRASRGLSGRQYAFVTEPSPGPQFVGTAAQHVATGIPIFDPRDTAGAARRSILGRRFDSLADIAVCETDPSGVRRLIGLVTIERLVAAAAEVTLAELAVSDPPVVASSVDQEVAAWRAVIHGESSLAVVDDKGHFLGLVPPRRMLSVLLEEHDEDMARLGGFLKGSSTARTAAQEVVSRRFLHRMPWLLLGLAGAMLSTGIVASFEESLSQNVALAFFLPGIVYMADAVGTQTETLVIRALSVGIGMRHMVRREALTGLLVGITLALAFVPFAFLYGDARVAATAALALLAACSVASLLAMAIPWLLFRLGRDPAFGSGPLATVVQDLVSISVYLWLALVLVG